MFVPDHPLRFVPLFRSYLWGGDRLAKRLGKKPPGEGIWAESWEVVDHQEDVSQVAYGPFHGWTLRRLIESFPQEMIGLDAPSERFPLLLKYLDCQRVLSVQVHPDDAYGARMPQPDRGKTEAWYVIDAEPGAVLYAGLKAGVDRDALERAISHGATEECLHALSPQPGDCIFIPAGTVHALGAGLIVAEIQQSSDCTFRLFDWNRVDRDGQSRPLHIEQAMQVINWDQGPVEWVQRPAGESPLGTLLVDCDKFQLHEWRGPGGISLPSSGYAIVTIPIGSAVLETAQEHVRLATGESVLLPNACSDARLRVDEDSVALIATPPKPLEARSI